MGGWSNRRKHVNATSEHQGRRRITVFGELGNRESKFPLDGYAEMWKDCSEVTFRSTRTGDRVAVGGGVGVTAISRE